MEKQNGRIYKVTCKIDETLLYIGSTRTLLCARMATHRTQSKTNDSKFYNKMRELGAEHFKIEMIEMLDTSDRNEMTKREQHYIDLLKPNMNTISAIPKKDMICFYTTKNGKKYGPYYKSAQQNSDAKKKHYQNNPEKLKKHYKNCKENQKKVRERIRVKLT